MLPNSNLKFIVEFITFIHSILNKISAPSYPLSPMDVSHQLLQPSNLFFFFLQLKSMIPRVSCIGVLDVLCKIHWQTMKLTKIMFNNNLTELFLEILSHQTSTLLQVIPQYIDGCLHFLSCSTLNI